MIANFAGLDENNETVLVEPPWYEMMEPVLQTDEMIRIPGFKIWADGAAGGGRGFLYMSCLAFSPINLPSQLKYLKIST